MASTKKQKLQNEDYKGLGVVLSSRFGAADKFPLAEPSVTPDLSFAQRIDKREPFTTLIPKHNEIASKVINIFTSLPHNQLEDFVAVAAYCRDRLNPKLFNYALSVALAHRSDTNSIKVPNFVETFPAVFIDGKVFQDARETASLVPLSERVKLAASVPITIPSDLTASDLEPEHRLAYFREDIGINLHHWHWHLVYPFSAGTYDPSIVKKDRRGELFYYMHNQILSRYNAERLCNKLARVVKFSNFRDPIPEAYYSKLNSFTASRSWPPRQRMMTWQDLNRDFDSLRFSVMDMETWRTRIDDAIGTGMAKNAKGELVPLTIDVLGNLIESSDLSVNPKYYGDLHNTGHLMTAYIHDPDGRYLEHFSVLGDEATAMRDPFFYRWHAFMDSMFQKFKARISPYLQAELEYPGVKITDFQVNEEGSKDTPNILNTHWMQSIVDLSRGLDFADGGAVYTRFTHLNHSPFNYTITIQNTGPVRFATCRIFMAPALDERGLPFQYEDQRLLFFETDKFVVRLQPKKSMIIRQSSESSVTIPFERTFRDLSSSGDPHNFGDADRAAFNFCGCGWPQHMLIPRGTAVGAPFQLFVMLSDYEHDKVSVESTFNISCSKAASFCGVKDRLYPDKRAMGFPFDRPSNSATFIRDFLTPNMRVTDVTIKHTGTTIQNPKNPKTAE